MTKVISNVHLIAAGINEHRAGSAIAEGGIAQIAEGICEAWFTPIRWTYGSDDKEVTGCLNLGDMFKGRHHDDGSEDGKFLPAMYRAVAENFGVPGEFTPADKMAYKRGFSIAAARHAGAPVKFTDVEVERKGRVVKVRAVQVPAEHAFKLVDEAGVPTDTAKQAIEAQKSNLRLFNKPVPADDKLLNMVKALPVDCVGGKHAVFGKTPSSTSIADKLREVAVEAKLVPPPPPRNGSSKGDKFREALVTVGKGMEVFLSDRVDDAPFAPCDGINAQLREVAERIAVYFAERFDK